MTTVAARTQPRFNRIHGLVMLLAAVLLGLALAAPHAEAAGKQRVVAISPFAASAMIKMGVKPIAIGQTIGGSRRLDPRLRNVKTLKLSHPNGPNLEVMAKIKPDLVFSSTRWSKGTSAMKRLGIRVVYADPTGLGQVYPTIRKIGRKIGRSAQAGRLIASMKKRVNRATKPTTKHPKILVVLGIGTTAMAFLKNSWGGQLVRAAGGNLVTGGATNSGGFARLSDEVVVAQNPDIIVVVPHGNSDDIGQVADYIENNEAWQTTNAVKNGKVFVSVDNELLQAGTDVGQIIGKIRSKWLKNW
ncbi:MAG: ABC transporter substrate-binding protein [Solirubrobacterales bacterium]|nr:ABC transporter substrate-binding protein [Solirubrobacterales bacterium]MCB8915885.1 ABC transporter substrate-binding protein [Thermoleophilales bacterium]